jgi:hypothetical protein
LMTDRSKVLQITNKNLDLDLMFGGN